MNTLYKKIMNINIKKSIINIVSIGIIFLLIAGIGGYFKFGSRIADVENQVKITREEKISKEDSKQLNKWQRQDNKEHEDNDVEMLMNFTTSDYVTIGIIAALGAVIGLIYWLVIVAYVIQKSSKVGANVLLFGLLALFTNIAAVIVLWLYISFNNCCSNCGKIQDKEAMFCTECGNILKYKCPNCSAVICASDKYCNNCGEAVNKINIDEENK